MINFLDKTLVGETVGSKRWNDREMGHL